MADRADSTHTIPRHMTRLLARRSELGYTTNPTLALTHEPEAITETQQDEITRNAHEHVHDRRRAELQRALEHTRRLADYHAAQLRHSEREARRLERRLAS